MTDFRQMALRSPKPQSLGVCCGCTQRLAPGYVGSLKASLWRGTTGMLNTHPPKMRSLKVGRACSWAMESVSESCNSAALQGVKGAQHPFLSLWEEDSLAFILEPWVLPSPASRLWRCF